MRWHMPQSITTLLPTHYDQFVSTQKPFFFFFFNITHFQTLIYFFYSIIYWACPFLVKKEDPNISYNFLHKILAS